MKIAIIINVHRSTDELKNQLNSTELEKKYNLSHDIFIVTPQELPDLLASLNPQTYNAFIVGGGDGTVRTVIQYLLAYPVPLAILPLGTFNLLAKSLNYPGTLDATLAMVVNNKTKQIDVAEVNGHIVMNHAWIGFYYHLLKLRKKHKAFFGNNKILKIIFNILNLFKSLPTYTLEVAVDGEKLVYKTCLIFIGNNEFSTNFLDLGEHKTLTTGLLSINILNCKNKWQLLLCIISILFGSYKGSKYVTSFTADKVSISGKKSIVKVVIDGDLYQIESPLHFTIHQKKLKVIVP